jgi:hypothetical protein
MKARWGRWLAFVTEREDGRVLAIVRILIGLVAFGELLEMILYGMVDAVWVDRAHGGIFTVGGNWLVRALGGPTPGVVWGLVAFAMVGALTLAAGFGGRITPFLTLQAYAAVTAINSQAGGGYDPLLTNAMWLLCIGNASTTLSVDARIKTGSFTGGGEVPAIARRLLVFQLLIVYGSTGLQKMSPVWTPAGGYSALYWVFQEPTWNRFDMKWTAHVYPLTQIASAITWHWELSAIGMFLYLWYRLTPERAGRLRRLANRYDLRLPYLAVGVMLHLGIAIALCVGPFSYASLAYYPAFFTWAELSHWRKLRFRLNP